MLFRIGSTKSKENRIIFGIGFGTLDTLLHGSLTHLFNETLKVNSSNLRSREFVKLQLSFWRQKYNVLCEITWKFNLPGQSHYFVLEST